MNAVPESSWKASLSQPFGHGRPVLRARMAHLCNAALDWGLTTYAQISMGGPVEFAPMRRRARNAYSLKISDRRPGAELWIRSVSRLPTWCSLSWERLAPI
jgi:hypothetical protein